MHPLLSRITHVPHTALARAQREHRRRGLKVARTAAMVSKVFQTSGEGAAAAGVLAAFGAGKKQDKAASKQPTLPSTPEAGPAPQSSSTPLTGWGSMSGLLVPKRSRVTGKRTKGRLKHMSKMVLRSVTPRFSERQRMSRAHGLHGPLFRKFQTAALVVRSVANTRTWAWQDVESPLVAAVLPPPPSSRRYLAASSSSAGPRLSWECCRCCVRR